MTQNIQWRKPVCQLDSDGLYVRQEMADLDVYTKDGGYIIPGGCIDAAPPEAREGFAARWNGEGWDYLEDNRGQIAYRIVDGTAVVIDKVGPLPDSLTLLEQPSKAHTWDGNAWVMTKEAIAEQLIAAKAAKLEAINQASQSFVEQAAELNKYPLFERDTWPIQKMEAEAWERDSKAETPCLQKIAVERGLDLDKLRAGALRKSKFYTDISFAMVGQRQALVDRLTKAKTLKAVEDIEVLFNVPVTAS